MYCSSCGVAVAQGLAYCNFCGAKLGGAKGVETEKWTTIPPAYLMAAMVMVFIVGLGAAVTLMSMLKGINDPANEAFIKAFAALTFLLMLGVEVMFTWLLLRRKRGAQEAIHPALSRARSTNELGAAQERLLPEPMPSVTEQTTRTLEPIYNERNSK